MACAPSRVALVVRDGRFCRSPDVREARYRSSHAPPPRHAHPCRSERCGNSALDAWYTDAPREPVPGKLQPPHRRSVSPSSPTSAARFRWHSEAFTSPSWLPPAAPRGLGWSALRDGPGGGGRGSLSPLKRDIRPVRASPTRASPTLPRQPPLHHPNRPRSTSFPPLRALESSLRIPPAIYRTAGAMSGVRAAQGGLREAPRVELSRRPLSARASGSTDPTETSTSAGSAPSAPSTPIAARPAAAVLMRPGAPAEASVAPLAHPPPAPRPRPHRLPLLRR